MLKVLQLVNEKPSIEQVENNRSQLKESQVLVQRGSETTKKLFFSDNCRKTFNLEKLSSV